MVFTEDAWMVCAAKAVTINDRFSYILVKQGGEYLILAEKRLGEFISRYARGNSPKTQFKTLMVFSGSELANIELERPFAEGAGALPVIIDRNLRSSFGTGIHTVSPAHNIEDLKLSYAHNLSRNGCIDHATGYLTQPAVLEGTDISKEREALDKIKAALSDVGQLYASYKHSCTEYRMTDEK